MSAASTPMPPRKTPSSGSRHTLFWPVLIFLLGSGTFTTYQVLTMEDQLDEVTKAVDGLDAKVRHAQYEKAKFFAIAKDVLRLAPRDPNAEQIVVEFKIRQLQAAQPVLMAQSTPATPATTNAAAAQPTAATNSAPTGPTTATNAAPIPPFQVTNAAPAHSPSPTPK